MGCWVKWLALVIFGTRSLWRYIAFVATSFLITRGSKLSCICHCILDYKILEQGSLRRIRLYPFRCRVRRLGPRGAGATKLSKKIIKQ